MWAWGTPISDRNVSALGRRSGSALAEGASECMHDMPQVKSVGFRI